MTRYQRIIFDGIEKKNSIQEIVIAILSILHREKWKLIKEVLEEAGIKPDNPLIFSALMYLQSQRLVEIDGGIPGDQRFTFEIIRLSRNGWLHIQDYKQKGGVNDNDEKRTG